MKTLSLSTASLVLSLAVGCGAKDKASADEPAPQTQPSEPAVAVKWADMMHAQRNDHMKKVVFPKMKAEFAAFDPRMKDFTCATCHGAGATDGTFKMPNPALPKLSQAMTDKHPKETQFMAEKVVPLMAEMLSTTPFDPNTQQGFGCLGCHLPE